MGRVDPRVGSGLNFRKIWREIFEMQYVDFAVSVVFPVEIVMKKCYISKLAKQ